MGDVVNARYALDPASLPSNRRSHICVQKEDDNDDKSFRFLGGIHLTRTQPRSDHTFIRAFIFGMGLIGMLDGIVFHQLLQWHNTYMLTNRFNQIVSDGLLHLVTTGLMVTGTILLWTDTATDKRLSNPKFLGGLLLGAGTFNFLRRYRPSPTTNSPRASRPSVSNAV